MAEWSRAPILQALHFICLCKATPGSVGSNPVGDTKFSFSSKNLLEYLMLIARMRHIGNGNHPHIFIWIVQQNSLTMPGRALWTLRQNLCVTLYNCTTVQALYKQHHQPRTKLNNLSIFPSGMHWAELFVRGAGQKNA